MNLDNDYDNDGNNIVPCPICLSNYNPCKQGGKCPEEDEYAKSFQVKETLLQRENKFRAHHQGFYWWIAPTGEVKKTSEYGSLEDAWAYRIGNYFETEAEANEALQAILET